MKNTKAVLIALLIVAIGLSALQISHRINWDLSNKNYTLATSYRDINKASSLFGLDSDELVNKLARNRDYLILFQIDFVTQPDLSQIEYPESLKASNFATGLEVLNLQVADSNQVTQLISYLNELSPDYLVLRSLSDITIPDNLKRWIRQNRPILGTVEFRSDTLTQKISRATELSYVRLHRVFDKEKGRLSNDVKIARYVRAVKERNIGVIEYRLPLNRDLSTTIEGLREVRSRLKDAGYDLGPIEKSKGAKGQLKTPTWILWVLISASLTASFLLMLGSYSPGTAIQAGLFVLVLVAAVTGMSLLPVFTRQVSAFLLALAGPVVAYRLLSSYGRSFREHWNLTSPFVDLLFVSLISIVVGLVISAILTDQSFMLKLNQFRGVKVSLFVPVAFIVFLYLFRIGFDLNRWDLGITKWIFGLLIGLVVFYLLFRSGNFTFLESSELEDAVRRWLESNLVVRPRFKEFVIGHPAMIVWLYLIGRYNQRFNLCKLGLLLLGFIGQTSIINTFAHIHSPLIISLIRTGNGVAGGLIIGFAAIVILYGGELLWKLGKR